MAARRRRRRRDAADRAGPPARGDGPGPGGACRPRAGRRPPAARQAPAGLGGAGPDAPAASRVRRGAACLSDVGRADARRSAAPPGDPRPGAGRGGRRDDRRGHRRPEGPGRRPRQHLLRHRPRAEPAPRAAGRQAGGAGGPRPAARRGRGADRRHRVVRPLPALRLSAAGDAVRAPQRPGSRDRRVRAVARLQRRPGGGRPAGDPVRPPQPAGRPGAAAEPLGHPGDGHRPTVAAGAAPHGAT